MRYNTIGRTGLHVSEISFGAGTGAGLMVNGAIEDQVAAVRAALDVGINHFDTAAFYGFGASEIYLGQALRTADAKDVLVTSKVAIGAEFLATREIRRAVRQSVEQTLSRLRRETIDILLVHNSTHRTREPYDPARRGERVARMLNSYVPPVTFGDIFGEDGVHEEVEALIAAGKVRHFGLSGADNDPALVRQAIATGRISLFNQTFHLLNPSAGFPAARAGRPIPGDFAAYQGPLFIEFDNVIEAARAAGVGVSVISPMAAGVLTDAAERGDAPVGVACLSDRFPLSGQFDRQVTLARRFKAVAQAAGLALSELAMRFVLSTPGVTTVVAGLSSADQVRSAASNAGKAPLGDDVVEALRGVWFTPPPS